VTHRAAHTPRAVDSLKHAEWRADRKGGVVSPACLHLPTRATGTGCVPSAHLRRTYDHAHAYNVNALSANSDGRTFLSADDLRVHWWDLEVADKCFNVVDLKPKVGTMLSPSRPLSRPLSSPYLGPYLSSSSRSAPSCPLRVPLPVLSRVDAHLHTPPRVALRRWRS
jgi:hypothetical protein